MDLRRRTRLAPEIATSSMNDIMFFLMLFFLIVATMVTPNALKLMLPQSNSKDASSHPVSVSIDPELNYFIDGVPVSVNEIEPILTQKLAGKKEPSVVLYSDKSVPVGNVIEVMNVANKMKIKMVLATSPEQKK